MIDILGTLRAVSAADPGWALRLARTADLRRAVVAYLRYRRRPAKILSIRDALSRHFDAAGVGDACGVIAVLDGFTAGGRLRWAGPLFALCKSVNGGGSRP